ncbi:hypothetical protein [Streptomyces sp. NPDC001966]
MAEHDRQLSGRRRSGKRYQEPIAAIGDVSGAVYDLVRAGLGDGHRIHPSAYVSSLASVGEDVVLGPGAAIHEYSTVRSRTVISRNVHIGYGCEIPRSAIRQGSELSHQATDARVDRRTGMADGAPAARLLARCRRTRERPHPRTDEKGQLLMR